MRSTFLLAAVCSVLGTAVSQAAELAFRAEEISNRLTVGYAVRIVDMNADKKPDIVVVDTERVIWFENPKWEMHTLIDHQTQADNVCLAPYDIDGDGQIDFALGADWRPPMTKGHGSIDWIKRGAAASEKWSVLPIGREATVHRIQWADLDSDGRSELIVVPLWGEGSTPPQFAEKPLRILAYKIPADPVKGPWVPQVLNEDLHVAHNFEPTDLDHDGKLDIVVGSFEGVSWLRPSEGGKWSRTLIGEGFQAATPDKPNRGASEIKHGRLASGDDFLATIEPWHGFQVVTYTRPPKGSDEKTFWTRQVLDDQLQWGHAVWCANLDGDADQELIIGVRDNKDAANHSGLRIYDPTDATGRQWNKLRFDPGGVAIEDLAAADLDGDGRTDIVAVGRATKNVRIYWNETKK